MLGRAELRENPFHNFFDKYHGDLTYRFHDKDSCPENHRFRAIFLNLSNPDFTEHNKKQGKQIPTKNLL